MNQHLRKLITIKKYFKDEIPFYFKNHSNYTSFEVNENFNMQKRSYRIFFSFKEMKDDSIPEECWPVVLLHEIGHYFDSIKNYNNYCPYRNNVMMQSLKLTNIVPETIKQNELNAWTVAINNLFPIFKIELTENIKKLIKDSLTSYQIDDNIIKTLLNKES